MQNRVEVKLEGKGVVEIGICRLQGDRRNNEQETYPLCRKNYWGRILRCERTKIWRHQIFYKRLRNVDAQRSIRKTVGCKNEEEWQKIRIYKIKYKYKRERKVRKNEIEA
jgi:hypothetical protein